MATKARFAIITVELEPGARVGQVAVVEMTDDEQLALPGVKQVCAGSHHEHCPSEAHEAQPTREAQGWIQVPGSTAPAGQLEGDVELGSFQ